MNQVHRFGLLIPAYEDGPAASALAVSLLAAAEPVSVPVSVVVADNGGNGDWGGAVPPDTRFAIIPATERGPGHARTAAARHLVSAWRQQGADLERAWIISLDADSRIESDFLARWQQTIERADADVLSGPSFFAAVEGGYEVPGDADAASAFLWSNTTFCERFVGLINVGGCNHAVRASVCEANDYYIQPTQTVGGQMVLVPGDDWDFGLRARLRGFSVERANDPTCLTSARRIAADPAGFLAGRAYEKPFEHVSAPRGVSDWPPPEDWAEMADSGRARIVAHFLMKGVVAGLPLSPGLRWFVGDDVWTELATVPELPPPTDRADWVAYRNNLVIRLFEPATFDLARRVGRRLAGAPTP